MRKVKVFQYNYRENKRVEVGEGRFIQYGIAYYEFEAGPVNFTSAIIEMPDGTVKNLQVELIQFVENNNN